MFTKEETDIINIIIADEQNRRCHIGILAIDFMNKNLNLAQDVKALILALQARDIIQEKLNAHNRVVVRK